MNSTLLECQIQVANSCKLAISKVDYGGKLWFSLQKWVKYSQDQTWHPQVSKRFMVEWDIFNRDILPQINEMSKL